MPYGPQGQWRPSDPGALARLVVDIATGQQKDPTSPPPGHQGQRRVLARIGGKARAEKLTPKQRREIASKAAKAKG